MPGLSPLSAGTQVRPRLKFIWGASKVINARWRLGLFGFYTRIHGYPRSGLAISLRGGLCWSLALSVAAYVGGAAAAAQWFKRNPYNRLGFVDVLTWPARRDHVARLRGEAWLAQGRAAMD